MLAETIGGMTAPRSADTEALDAFVEQLIETSFTLMTLVNGMMSQAAEGRSSPDAPPISDVLRSLLRDVLPPLLTSQSRDGVTAATQLLDAATEIVCRDIYIVPPQASRGRPRRRARGPH